MYSISSIYTEEKKAPEGASFVKLTTEL